MPDVTIDNTSQLIIDDIVGTLSTATVDGSAVFAGVRVHEDVGAFIRTADPLKGIQCGIVPKQPEQAPSIDNGGETVFRISMDVIVRFVFNREIGADETGAVTESQRLTAIVRSALDVDSFRGGLASFQMFNGRLIPATDLNGGVRVIASKDNEAFYTFAVPVICAWEV